MVSKLHNFEVKPKMSMNSEDTTRIHVQLENNSLMKILNQSMLFCVSKRFTYQSLPLTFTACFLLNFLDDTTKTDILQCCG